jgi:hypothetical protein
MQATKDSFYVTLRDRLAAYDPQRTITVNGATRPAILVAENERPEDLLLLEGAFILHWGNAHPAQAAPSTFLAMECRVAYRTSGTSPKDEVNRGRELGALDGDLLAICSPAQAAKSDYSSGSARALGSTIFWTQPVLNVAKDATAEFAARDASVTVFFFPEVKQP